MSNGQSIYETAHLAYLFNQKEIRSSPLFPDAHFVYPEPYHRHGCKRRRVAISVTVGFTETVTLARESCRHASNCKL